MFLAFIVNLFISPLFESLVVGHIWSFTRNPNAGDTLGTLIFREADCNVDVPPTFALPRARRSFLGMT